MKNKFFIVLLVSIFFFPFYVFADNSGEIAINVKNETNVFTYNNYYVSNFSRVENGTVDKAIPYFDNRQVLVGRNCGINGRNPCGTYITEDADITSSGSITRDMLIDLASPRFSDGSPLHGGAQEYPNFKNVLKFQFWTHKDYAHLEFNKNYTIGLKIKKEPELFFGGVSEDLVHISITDNDNPTGAIEVNNIEKTARLVRVSDNVALLIINFTFDNYHNHYDFSNFSLNNISIDWVDHEEDYTGSEPNVKKLLYYHQIGNGAGFILQNISEEHVYHYQIKNVYFLEDGLISVDGAYVNIDGELSEDIPEDYVTITDEDLDITNNYEADVYCEPLDIACHIGNLGRKIQNIFKRIGEIISSIFSTIVNALKSLFLPSDDFISNFFEDQYNFLRSKLGILLAPFTIIGDILNRFINLQPNHVFSFNGYTLPIFDKPLIPAFNFNMVDFFNEKTEIASLYNYYKIGVVAIIYILFLMLCYKKFKNLIGGDSN